MPVRGGGLDTSGMQRGGMPFHPDDHHRQSLRWRVCDYSRPGAYFVTIVASRRLCAFGNVRGGVMYTNDAGRMVSECWDLIATQFELARPDEFIVMPNH